jgi:signal transduction histidine kinase
MRKVFGIAFLVLCSLLLHAQYNVTFIVRPPDASGEPVFLAGSFNKWSPGDKAFELAPVSTTEKRITVSLSAGLHEYKFTRGNWTTVETTEAGLDITNRVVGVSKDTTIRVRVQGWLDRFKDISRMPLATQWQVAYNRSFFYLERDLDSSYKYAQQAAYLANELSDKKYDAAMARILGRIMQRQGSHERALEYYLKQLALVQELKDTLSTAFCLLDLGHLFLGIKEYEKAKSYYFRVIRYDPVAVTAFGHSAPILALVRLGRIYSTAKQLDSADLYATQAYQLSVKLLDRKSQSESLTLLGTIARERGNFAQATQFFHGAIEQARLYNSSTLIAENYQHLAAVFNQGGQKDSAFYYARQGYALATYIKNPFTIADASSLLVTLFKGSNQSDSALTYLEQVIAAKDSLFSKDKNLQLQTILFNEQLQHQEIEAQHEQYKTRIRTIGMAVGILFLLFLCIALWINNHRKQRINALLNKRGQKIRKTLSELRMTVTELRKTQTQLIQKEKMASLGELTAGIAHEIQNPLNFINNFSEVSVELAKEMKEELGGIDVRPDKKSNLIALVDDLVQNQQKISDHGHRADGIVKGMLQHSRNTSGQREPININILADEFLRLSYHGLRAKDKTFSAIYITDFDDSIGKVTVVPQNIGRVLLNLFNNAFYSVTEKRKQRGEEYKPTVWVRTKRIEHHIEICVRDNGLGIPDSVLNKIFQPFYTTKPSGHGTGLGLSLSYDIITKEHEGTLQVDTREGEYAEFIILLPAV